MNDWETQKAGSAYIGIYDKLDPDNHSFKPGGTGPPIIQPPTPKPKPNPTPGDDSGKDIPGKDDGGKDVPAVDPPTP